jgi:hypothetical protein
MTMFIEPTMYELSDFHGELHLTYFPQSGSSPPGVDSPRVMYRDKNTSREFAGNAVQVAPTNIGKLVTVTIRSSIDTDSTLFSFIVPRVNLIDGSTRAQIQTEGITTTHRFSPIRALNRGQRDVYRVTPLVGTASTVIAAPSPLEEPNAVARSGPRTAPPLERK